jgi:hypothetical protein
MTLDTLLKSGYTGKYYLVIDNEDNSADKYYENFGKDKVLMFDKLKKSQEFDTIDVPYAKRNAVVYARNVCFDLAKELGLTYFLELDDDYYEFSQRYNKNNTLSNRYIQDFDSCVELTLDFLDTSGALSVAWAQNGDFIGGLGGSLFNARVSRKCMNSFFCRVDRPFTFIGRINEDVNTYVLNASRGNLMLTVADLSLNQVDTQQNKGGMTDFYLDGGTYIKSFYSVISNPSSVKISTIGNDHIRFHHSVDWEHCAVKIISDRFKK